MRPACVTMDLNAVSFEQVIELRTPKTIHARPSDHDLTVIIPAFNEEKRLPWTLTQLSSFLNDWGLNYRILIADDGSTDGTATLTNDLGPRFSTIKLNRQSGKGRAVKTAMLHATGRVVAFTDADLPFDLCALRHGYDILKQGNSQVIFGARDLAESLHLVPRHWSRQIATHVFRAIVKILISNQVTDTQCGLKLFNRQAALDIFSRVSIDGFAFDAEVVYLTHLLNLPFKRIPVTFINDFASTISLRNNALPMLGEVLRLWWRANISRRQIIPQLLYHMPESAETPSKQAA